MSTRYKVLGQLAGSYSSDQTLYTVPTSSLFRYGDRASNLRKAIVSNVIVTNLNLDDAIKYSMAVVPSGESVSSEHYIVKDYQINAVREDGDWLNFVPNTHLVSLDLTLDPGAYISFQVTDPADDTKAASVKFNAFGAEIF